MYETANHRLAVHETLQMKGRNDRTTANHATRLPRFSRVATSVLALLIVHHAALAADGAAPGTPTPTLAIRPMTTVASSGSGYFEDPYPVHLAGPHANQAQVFSGTTKAVMRCAYPISARCFSWTPDTVDVSELHTQIAAAGATVTNIQNIDLFQDDAGGWHGVVAIGVHSPSHPDHWTVLVHAHPAKPAGDGGIPLAWAADTVLSGSFANPVDGNYDGKYFEDDGKLYLLYVKNFVPKPALRNGIVIQRMLSPTEVAPEAPVTLLMPGDRFGPLNSEWYGQTQAKLVEAPYIIKLAGKYALIYSTGAYQQVGYKAGVAWSDTLFPTNGKRYRKVLATDTNGIWGKPGALEVRYLVQSQQTGWPNYTGTQVISPGVASAAQGSGGAWWLYFAGFDPSDRPLVAPGVAEADHRRPYFAPLRADVPADRSVAQASDAELATWLQPATQ